MQATHFRIVFGDLFAKWAITPRSVMGTLVKKRTNYGLFSILGHMERFIVLTKSSVFIIIFLILSYGNRGGDPPPPHGKNSHIFPFFLSFYIR